MADDTSGIPDVDLTPILNDLEANQDKGSDAVATDEKPDLAQFKTPEAAVKGYKDVQAYATKVSQENKDLQAELAEARENQRLSAHAQPQQQPQGNFNDRFYENPEGTVNDVATQAAVNVRITEVLEEEDLKDTETFQERYQWAMMAKQKNPQLGTSPAGVRKLFKEGDKLKKASQKKNAAQALESVFGEPLSEEQLDNLRTLVKGDKPKSTQNLNAYMPDIDSSTKTGADVDQKIDLEGQITNAEKSGDIDGVIKGLFHKALAE